MKAVKQNGGGCGTDNEAVLERAQRALAAKKEVILNFPSAAVKKEDGRMDSKELAKYVNDLASGAFEFVLNVVLPFFHKMDQEIAEVGDEVKFDQCEDGDQTKQARREDYESTLIALQLFSPENDGILREEAEIPGRKQFVEALCIRVRHTTQVALLVDKLRCAGTKDELENLLANAKTDPGKDAKNVFVKNAKGSIHAFGRTYGLTPEVFDRYHEFAHEKLATVTNARSCDLAKAHKDEVNKQKQKVSAKDDSNVSPEVLLFGNPEEVNEKTTLLSWKFQEHENVIKLRRSGDRLYIVDAVGKPLETLEAMRQDWEEPFIPLKHILTKDGEHLCPEKTVDGKSRYEFCGFVQKAVLPMVRWIRTAAGECVPSRLLPKDTQTSDNVSAKPNGAKQRPVKAEGELLTDREFLYFRGIGDYDLVYEVGFHYEPRDEEGKPNGQSFSITERAIARIQRKEVEGKDKIALKSASTEELAKLLEAGGAEVEHEFFEGARGSSLPIPIYLGISQAFGRLKVSEAKAS